MLTKRHLNSYFMRVFYHAKNIGGLFFVPVFVFIVLIPILNYMQYTRTGIGIDLYVHIIRYSQWLIPFFSVWNVIFALRETVEAEGYEIFYMSHQRLKIIDVLGLFLISFILTTGLFAFYSFLFPNMWLEYIRILSICFLFLGLTYGITYLFKSITPTLIILVLYVLSSILFVGHYPIFPFFYTSETMSWELLFELYFLLLGLGCIFVLMGYYSSKKYY